MHNAPPLGVMDWIGPALGAALFVLAQSRLREPARLRGNALFAAGATGAYLSGGFGGWELLYPIVAAPIVYRALDSYRFVGVAWLMHAAWDLAHHLWGNAIWPFMPTSSFGCLIFDTTIALWFLTSASAARPARAAL